MSDTTTQISAPDIKSKEPTAEFTEYVTDVHREDFAGLSVSQATEKVLKMWGDPQELNRYTGAMIAKQKFAAAKRFVEESHLAVATDGSASQKSQLTDRTLGP